MCVCACVCVCVFRQHFFVNANFIKHNRYFMSTYFLLDPFEFPYYFYRIQGELIYVWSIVVCIPSTFCPTQHLKKHSTKTFNSAFKNTFNTTTKNSHRQHNNIRTSK